MQDIFFEKFLGDVFLYLEMGDKTVFYQVSFINLSTTNIVQNVNISSITIGMNIQKM